MNLVETLPLFAKENRSALTDSGLDLLAYKSMLTPARFRARRAWPAAHGPLTSHPGHMRYILAFMFSLQRRGVLLKWQLVHARYRYSVAATAGDLARPRHIDIVPDSSGVLATHASQMPFWLEIDRGTRNGRRLVGQLEKYILLRFADAASDPIPMLLYIVAEGGETRARLVARRLIELTARYRLRRPPAILITTWELLTDGGRWNEPNPLRPVWRLPFLWRQFLPPIPPNKRKGDDSQLGDNGLMSTSNGFASGNRTVVRSERAEKSLINVGAGPIQREIA